MAPLAPCAPAAPSSQTKKALREKARNVASIAQLMYNLSRVINYIATEINAKGLSFEWADIHLRPSQNNDNREDMRQQHFFVILSALLLSVLAFIGTSIAQSPRVALAHANHSFVIGSDPIDGSTINTLPSVMRIFFNAPISSISSAHIYYIQGGTLVDVGAAESTVNGSNPRELDTLIKTPGSQPQGSYEVRWTAVSNDDGHTTYGLIGFNLGFSGTGLSGTPTLGPTTSNTLDGEGGIRTLTPLSILAIAWDWLALLALTGWLAILCIEHLLLPASGRTLALLDRARKRTYPLQTLCLYALLLSEIVTLLLRSNRLSESLQIGRFDTTVLLQLVTSTNYGWLWIARIVLLLLALLLLHGGNRAEKTAKGPQAPQQPASRADAPQPRVTIDLYPTGITGSLSKEKIQQLQGAQREATKLVASSVPRYTPLWLLIAGALLLTYAISDGITQVVQPHFSAIVFAWLNLVGWGCWFGGMVYLGFILLPLLPAVALDHHAESLVLLLRRLIPFLLTGMGITLVSDFFLSEASMSDVRQFITDAYGRTLLVQIILLMLLLFLSLYTLLRLCPKLTHQALQLPVVDAELPAKRSRRSAIGRTERWLRSLATLHTWLAAGVLLCAALMAFFAPPILFPNITYSNPSTSTNGSTTMQTRQFGDLSVTLQVLPGHTSSANTVILMINESNGASVTDAQVQLTTNMLVMDMGTEHATIKRGNPLYIATFDQGKAFSMAGLWSITVTIQRPAHAPVQGTFQIMLTQ